MWKVTMASCAVAACGFPRPADVPDDAVGLTVQVSTSGDDASDGLANPVKTVKRAIGLAAANKEITMIAVAGGRYEAATGETFPYTVPPNVTVAGPAGGGAILAGNKAGPGLILGSGTLKDLEFEDFTVAVTSNGQGQLTNVRVRASDIAVRGEAAARLMVNNLDITGAAGNCATGLEINGSADLVAIDFSARALGTSLRMRDQSTARLVRADVTGDASCTASPVLLVSSSASFSLDESILDGGVVGIDFRDAAAPTQVTLTNVTIRNAGAHALQGGTATVHMTGGVLSGNGNGGLSASGGAWTFADVEIKQNMAFGIYLQNAVLLMHGCSVIGNGTGIHVITSTSVNLGTSASVGNNVFQNRVLGISIDGAARADAVGNTWNPHVQGADSVGRYGSPAVVQGPVPITLGNNFALGSDQSTLQR
jgi:hypothetical protein